MEKEYQIFGIRAVMEAVLADENIDKVFVQKGLKGNLFEELQQLLRKKNIATSQVPVEKLNRFTKKNHQGVVATLSPVSYAPFEETITQVLENEQHTIFLILDHLSDVRNFGAIIRTAEAVGVSAIIIPSKGSVSVTADTVKTSAGAVFKIPIIKVENLKDAIYFLQGSGVKIVAATEKTDSVIFNTQLTDFVAVIMGSEDVGIQPSLLKMADFKVKLPMLGQISSLNVSVACGVFLYEIIRQRQFS